MNANPSAKLFVFSWGIANESKKKYHALKQKKIRMYHSTYSSPRSKKLSIISFEICDDRNWALQNTAQGWGSFFKVGGQDQNYSTAHW